MEPPTVASVLKQFGDSKAAIAGSELSPQILGHYPFGEVEVAGVIFTNGDEPYVKLRKGEAWERKRAVGGASRR